MTKKRPKVKLKTPPVLYGRTQRLVRAVRKRAGMPVVCYWNSGSGGVCQNDLYGFYEALRTVGRQKEIGLFVKSHGGTGRASLRIVNLLRRYADRIVAFVPLQCASAATMIALGADEIRMGPLAYLTAVDTSLTHALSPVDLNNDRVSVSQDELRRIVTLWRQAAGSADSEATQNPYAALFSHVHPLVIGAVDRASSLSVRLCTEILSYHMEDRDAAERISSHLNSDYPAHGYPILEREARRIGLNVTTLDAEINERLLDLHGLYSEMGQRALTDYDERNYHNNEIRNIIECVGMQIYYQVDKDWHYRERERRWVSLNDSSSWRKVETADGKVARTVLHVR